MAGKYDINLYQGAMLSFDFTLENDDGQGGSTPVDLSDAAIHMQIRQNHRSTNPMLDLAAEGYIWIADAKAGKIQINVPGWVTKEIYIPTSGVYDIVLDFGYGNVIRPLQGLVHFYPEVTKVDEFVYQGVTPQ